MLEAEGCFDAAAQEKEPEELGKQGGLDAEAEELLKMAFKWEAPNAD